MVTAWVTNGTTTLEAMVDPINAACDEGFVPDRLQTRENLEKNLRLNGIDATVMDCAICRSDERTM